MYYYESMESIWVSGGAMLAATLAALLLARRWERKERERAAERERAREAFVARMGMGQTYYAALRRRIARLEAEGKESAMRWLLAVGMRGFGEKGARA